jgi:hypothetical protein
MVPNESFVLFPYNTAKHRLAKLVVKGRSIMLTFPTVSSRVAWLLRKNSFHFILLSLHYTLYERGYNLLTWSNFLFHFPLLFLHF